ncbi:MAG: tetratricopeptide repeat protein [Pirellula sp.]|nr:tetratricopeptide repeat protein [Pirellula sp.]
MVRFHFYHCFGRVGQDGSVSARAINHYVELVHMRLAEAVQSADFASFEDLILSVAIARGGQKRIEVEMHPMDATIEEKEHLLRQIESLEAPLIHASPLAFALHITTRSKRNSPPSISIFPRLRSSIESKGLENALLEAFDMPSEQTLIVSNDARSALASWWRRLLRLIGLKQQPHPNTDPPEPSARDLFTAQEHWIQSCEAMADECSWIDLKRGMVNAPDDYRYQIAFAAKHAQQEAWASAIECYEKLTHRFENLAPLIGRCAACQRNAGNSQAALIAYSKAIEMAPHEASYWWHRSLIYQELNAWEQAERDLDEAIRLFPIDPDLFLYRAQVRLQRHAPSGAIEDYREAVRLDPNFGYAHFRLGWLYSCQEENNGKAAIDHLTKAVALMNDMNVRLHRAMAYLTQNKYALAMEDCEYSLKHEPNNALAHGIRGRILQCEGQFDEAIVACSRAIDLGHESPAVFLSRAIAYAATDQPTLAISDCDAALALEPENAWAIQLHGRLRLQMGDLDSAMKAFEQARDLIPDWAEPREHLSLVHRMKENPQASVEELTSLIERQPKQASHYVHRAFAYTQLQEYQKAASDYDRAIELEPENEQLYYLRGTFRTNCQDFELALADFERFLAIHGGNDNVRAHQADLLMRLNRYQEALDIYAELIAKHPENPLAYSGRAFASAALGNTEQAQEDTYRAIEIAPEMAGGISRSTEAASFYRLMRAQDYDAALEAADNMVADYPEESLGYRLRAHVRWEREEYVESCEDYTRVMDMDGPTSDCLSSRGQVQAELGEWELALADLNQAVDMARKAGETIVLAYALNGRSLTLAGMGRDQESERDFGESVSLCPTNPWVYYHRGIRMFQRKERKEARILLELALEFDHPPLSKRKKQRASMALSQLASEQQ